MNFSVKEESEYLENSRFSVIGGDTRTVKLIEMLSKEAQVYTYGLEQATIELCESSKKSCTIESSKSLGKGCTVENSKSLDRGYTVENCKSLEEAIQKSQIILGPMPLSKDGETINAPYAKEKIAIKDIIESLEEEKTFIAGAIKNDVYEACQNKNINIIDLMKQEELTVLNTIATAEGAIQIAIENTERNIQGSKILILGFGRVGKVVAKKFKVLDSNVTCAARKVEDLAWIQTLGYESTNINEIGKNLKEFDIIINTVPQIILTKKELSYINKKAIIIDLASKPGGVEQEAIKELEIKYIWALALPGKVSPVTSAEYMKNTICNVLKKK